jgi:uncharacterized protein YecT (DUF1311 family)
MKMPISEIIDRYTITKLKSERTEEDVQKELECYKKEIDSYDADLNGYIKSLYEANGKLWDTEGAIRRGEDLPLEEIGRLALTVRDLNCDRNAIKAEIVEKFAEGFKELKINYNKVDYGRNEN